VDKKIKSWSCFWYWKK